MNKKNIKIVDFGLSNIFIYIPLILLFKYNILFIFLYAFCIGGNLSTKSILFLVKTCNKIFLLIKCSNHRESILTAE